MTESLKHHRGCAGTSYTKAVAMLCRGQMHPVSIKWNQHLIGTGSQA